MFDVSTKWPSYSRLHKDKMQESVKNSIHKSGAHHGKVFPEIPLSETKSRNGESIVWLIHF